MFYSIVDSKFGKIGLAATDAGLCRVTLDTDEDSFLDELRGYGQNLVRDDKALSQAAQFLNRTFAGTDGASEPFGGPIDYADGTPFQRSVWEVLRTIPHGQTRSYKWVAEKLGDANKVRAVGQANGKNPITVIVPCHRVVNADGGLGGYALGLSVKTRLLQIEGALPASLAA